MTHGLGKTRFRGVNSAMMMVLLVVAVVTGLEMMSNKIFYTGLRNRVGIHHDSVKRDGRLRFNVT